MPKKYWRREGQGDLTNRYLPIILQNATRKAKKKPCSSRNRNPPEAQVERTSEILIPPTSWRKKRLSAISQNRPLKVEIEGFKTSHFFGTGKQPWSASASENPMREKSRTQSGTAERDPGATLFFGLAKLRKSRGLRPISARRGLEFRVRAKPSRRSSKGLESLRQARSFFCAV
jgi:hypothetical protein